MTASISAIASYFKLPAVWLNGIVAALGILAIYFATVRIGYFVGLAVLVLLMIMLPFFFAGTYGIILDGNTKKGAFLIYARYGYSRCLSPALFLFDVSLLILMICNYLGLGIISLLILLPIIFFTYFADIMAIRHNLKAGQAIKDSASLVISGSILVVVFFIGNIVACLLAGIALDLVFNAIISALTPAGSLENLVAQANIFLTDSLTSNLNTTGTTIDETAFTGTATQFTTQVLSTPGLTLSIALSTAITALFFVPFFVAYKAYFFRDLLTAQAATAAVMKAAQEKEMRQYVGQPAEPDAEQRAGVPEDTPTPAESAPMLPQQTEEQPAAAAHDPHAGEDGEYDAKGRWFKYK